ncbi:hypothetical protein AgCh_009908 [Apium graveolens]
MNRIELPIRERLGNVLQFPVGVDVVVAESEISGLPINASVKKQILKVRAQGRKLGSLAAVCSLAQKSEVM